MKSTRLILTACVVAVAAAPGWAQPMADKVPAGSLVYAGWAGKSLTFDGSMFGQLVGSAEVKRLCKAVEGAVLHNLQGERQAKGRKAFQRAWAMGAIAWRHPACVALFDLAPPPADANRRGPPLVPVGAILLDLGKDRAAFEGELKALLALVADEVPMTTATVGKVSFQQIATPAGPCGLGFVGNTFFLCIGDKAPETIVNLAGGKAKSLAKDPAFAAAMKDVSGTHVQLAYYVDVARGFAIADKMMGGPRPAATGPAEPTRFRKIIKALGVDKATALAGASSIVDRGMADKTRLFSPAPHRGILSLFAGKPLGAKAMKGVPADALFVAMANLDASKILAEVKRVVTEIDVEAGQRLDAMLKAASDQLGADIEKDLVASVGDQWTLISAPSLGGFLTGTVLTVELKDAAKFTAALAKVEALLSKAFAPDEPPPADEMRRFRRPPRRPKLWTQKAGKLDIRYVVFPGLPIPAAPAWAVHENRFYLAAFPQVIVAAVTGTNEKPLAASPAFAALRKRVAAKPMALSYVNAPAVLRQLYGLPLMGGTVLANMAGRQTGMAFVPDMLPALPTMEKYVRPYIATISADAKGITSESYGSLPGGGLMMAPGPMFPLAVSIALPTLSRARGLAKRALSMANLNGIGKSCVLYMVQNNDVFPPDMNALIEKEIMTAEILISPTSGRKARKDSKGHLIGPPDYVYLLAGMKDTDIKWPGRTILAYERPEINRLEGACVLYADGHVAWCDMATFNADLKFTKKFLARK